MDIYDEVIFFFSSQKLSLVVNDILLTTKKCERTSLDEYFITNPKYN
jgi:hypothetical protein